MIEMTQYRKHGILVLAALVAAVAIGSAQADNALLLRYKYKPGAVQAYVCTGAMIGTVAGGSEAPSTPFSAKLDLRLSVKTLTVDSTGAANQATTIERMVMNSEASGMKMDMLFDGSKVTVTVNGSPMEMPQGLPGMDILSKPIQATVDTCGRVLKTNLTEAGELLAGVDPSMLQQTTVFPEGPVRPGDTWSQAIKLSLPMMGQKLPLSVKVSYTFVGVEQYKGRNVARILFAGSSDASGTDAAQLLQGMTMTFNGHELFDYEVGVSPVAKVQMVQKTAAGGAQPATMNMSGDFDIVLQ